MHTPYSRGGEMMCCRSKWSNFMVDKLKLQHVKTSEFFKFGNTWLINICPTAVERDALSFSADVILMVRCMLTTYTY